MTCLAVLSLLAGGAFARTRQGAFPGWLGEVHRSERIASEGEPADQRTAAGERWLEVKSWKDRIFVIHNFLTPEECDWIVDHAKPRLSRSSVVDSATGGGEISDVRTSSGMFFSRAESDVIAAVEERIAQWTMVDAGQGEGIQVLDYKNAQKYDPHFDYFFHEAGTRNGGNRLLTVLMYLTDVEEGGETVFPNVAAPEDQRQPQFSECAMRGLAVKPRKGDASIFWSITTAGTVNSGSLHGSCPVIRGEKFSATKWVHVAHYAAGQERAQKVEHVVFAPPPPPAPEGCTNSRAECKGWADSGECVNNAGFMIGTLASPGACLLACGRCDLMSGSA